MTAMLIGIKPPKPPSSAERRLRGSVGLGFAYRRAGRAVVAQLKTNASGLSVACWAVQIQAGDPRNSREHVARSGRAPGGRSMTDSRGLAAREYKSGGGR